MEEFIRCAQTVCYGSTNEERNTAEAQLSVIIEQEGALPAFLDALYSAEDTVFFFICLGLQRILWKRWGQLEQQDQSRVTQALSEALTTRGASAKTTALQVFARRKLEQVVSCVCAQLGSLDPVVAVLQALSVPAAGEEEGHEAASEIRRLISQLSLLRTVLEETLNLGDPRLTPQQQEAAQAAAVGMVVPATALACSTIQRFMGELGTTTDPSSRQKYLALISLSIDALKVILAKIPIGPHITADVLRLLFALSQLGAGADDQLIPVASSALEGLQELMAKRFVPSEGLLLLAEKASTLLTEYRGACTASSSPACLPALLDFICSFAVTHVARCMQLPGGQATVFQLVQGMVAISTKCKEPEVLVKLTGVWSELLEIETISGYLVGGPDAAHVTQMEAGEKLSLVKHFLYASLCTRNESLAEDYLQDMIEGCPVGLGGASAAIVDLKLRKIAEVGQLGLGGASAGPLSGISSQGGDGSGGGAVEGAEEESNSGSALVLQVQQFTASMSACPLVRQMLVFVVEEMSALLALQQQQGQGQERRQAASMDLAHLARVLTCCLEPPQVMLSLLSLLVAQAQAQAQMVTYSLETSHLWVTLCHVLGQMSHYIASLPSDQRRQAMHQTLPQLLQITEQGCDSRLSPPPASVIISTVALLLQWLSAAWIELGSAHGQDAQWDSLVASALQVVRNLGRGTMGPEAHGLLACCCDVLDHGSTAQAASGEVRAACEILRSAQTVGPVQAILSLKAAGNFFGVKRALVTLTAIFMHHGSSGNSSISSVSSLQRKQLIASIGDDFPDVLSELTSLLFQLASVQPSVYDCDELQRTSSGLSRGRRDSSGTTHTQIISVTPVAINLSYTMLQTLGRTAVHGAAQVFRSGVHFFSDDGSGNGAGMGAAMLQGASATMILLARHMLKLLLALTEGGASRGANASALRLDELSLRLLNCMSNALGTDAKLVAELLQDVLLAGTSAARTFWCSPVALKSQLAMPGSANGNTGTSNGSGSSSGGTNDNARSIVNLICNIIAASMGAAVPPQDALVATEGALAVVENLTLLRTPWFFSSGVWRTLVTALLRALVCRHHMLHHTQIESLLFSQLMLPLVNQQTLLNLQESAQRLSEAQLLPVELQAGSEGRGVIALCFNCLAGIAEETGCVSGAQTALSRIASAAGDTETDAVAEKLLRAAITAVSAEVAKVTIRDT